MRSLLPAPLRRRSRPAPVLAALVAASGLYAAWACGPWFSPWMVDDESHLVGSPLTFLGEELARSPRNPEFRAEIGGIDQALEADLRDLEEIQVRQGVVLPRRQELARKLDDYRRYLGWVPKDTGAEEGYQTPLIRLRKNPEIGRVYLPEGLPGEMASYLEGAEAYHRGNLPAARAAWERLLALPAAERRYRSTWAAYMLGRSRVEDDPEGAVTWFERTRVLAREGFRDALHLAAESFGWQARAELRRGRPEVALGLYLQHAEGGDPTAPASIRVTCARVFADPRALDAALRTKALDLPLVAYALSRWGDGDDSAPGSVEAAQALLEGLKRNGREGDAETARLADRLAWLAYQGGDFAGAEAWLGRSPAGRPMAGWIRAKLHARAGRLAEAEAALAAAVEELPVYAASDPRLGAVAAFEAILATRPQARAELGFVQLARGEYDDALLSLAQSGYWQDAAYVAERVLTVAELRALVDRHFPAPLAARYSSSYPRGSYTAADEPAAAYRAARLRTLLARRLAREGNLGAAAPYFPPRSRRNLARYAGALRQGRDPHRSASARAEALFRAACLQRQLGLTLFASENEPDWASELGSFDPGSLSQRRLDPEVHPQTAASEDERRRVAASAPEPARRFHYRYRAARLALEAARLLPPQTERRAAFLATAGGWIAAADPRAAEPLYRELVRSCGRTPVGAAAARRHWFPPESPNACPSEIRRLSDEVEVW